MIADSQAQSLSAKAWQAQAEARKLRWQKITLRLQQPKRVEVARVRVRETITQAWRRPGPERWLLIERHGDGRYKYYLSNASHRTSVRTLFNWAHQRWKIEQSYQQLKEELGLDHFEGRSWRGLHHHLTLCFLAYGFLQLLRQRKKSSWPLPSVRRWLHRLLRFTQCPHCRQYHLAVHLPLFSSA
jgi:SRSO17 transposase